MIELSNVSVRYGSKNRKLALESVNLRVEKEKVVVVGPNGSGKTTILKTLLGLVQIDSGRAVINGVDVKNIRGDNGVSTNLSDVYRLMRVPVKDLIKIYSELKDGDAKEAEDLFHNFGLESIMEKNIDELSSGEQKMVGNILSLSFSPSIILMDEPFDNVDQGRRMKLIEMIRNIQSEIIINTHEFDLLNRLDGWALYFIIEGKLFGKFQVSQLKNLYINRGEVAGNICVLDTSFGKFSITENSGAVPIASARNFNAMFEEVI